MSIRALVVDDDIDIANVIADRLRATGMTVLTVADGQSALETLDREQADLVLMDVEMPLMNGPAALDAIRRKWPGLPVIMMTAYGSIGLAVDAMRAGASDFITKPIDFSQLAAVLARALERHELAAESAKLLGEVSHEFKNLMMPIMLGTDLLESEVQDLRGRLAKAEHAGTSETDTVWADIIQMLRATTHRMHERTKNLADSVKMMRTPVRFAPCHIGAVIDQVVATLSGVAQAGGVTLETVGLDALPVIDADDTRLFTLFFNLVNNAIPEVPRGGRVSVLGASDAAAREVIITIRDTGRGMPPQMAEKLFREGLPSRKPGGSGLGGQIVKDMVQAHGGHITAESIEGLGTTIQIRLPQRPRPPRP